MAPRRSQNAKLGQADVLLERGETSGAFHAYDMAQKIIDGMDEPGMRSAAQISIGHANFIAGNLQQAAACWGTTAGQAAFPEQYGPLCYDSILPAVSGQNSSSRDRQQWYKKPIPVSITATDPGAAASGIQGIYFGINDQCVPTQLSTCAQYGGPFTLSDDGIYNIVAYAEDVAGNFSQAGHDLVRLDRTPPVTVATLTGGGFARSAEITLAATDAVSGVFATYYQLDGGPETLYTELIIVTKVGQHTLKYWSVDNAHNTEAKNTLTFTLRHSKEL